MLAFIHDDGTIEVPDDAVSVTASGEIRPTPLPSRQRAELWRRVHRKAMR